MLAPREVPGWVAEKWNKIEKINTTGQRKVEEELKRWGFEAIHNFMLCDDKGLTHIDHVVKTVFGIVVIETKDYTGFVFGDRSWRYWTRRVNDGVRGVETTFYNPIWQNHRHVRAAKFVVSENYIPIMSHVVFAGDAYLDDSISSDVIKLRELSYILFNADKPRLDYARLEAAWGRLKNAAEASAPRRSEFLSHMKSRQDWDSYDAVPL